MNPFNIDPEQFSTELRELGDRLFQSWEVLSRLDDVRPGCTPRECVFEKDRLRLYRYQARKKDIISPPLLIVYALVNRPYMIDLQEQRSLVRGLLDAGVDVYLIDWGYPDDDDSKTCLDDYINDYLDSCVDHICQAHGLNRINLLGICQGGTFSLCYSALHGEKIANLVTTITPVDFHTRYDRLSSLVRHIDIDLCVDTLGNIPGQFLNGIFMSLKPYRLMSKKYIDLLDILDDEAKLSNFMYMEKWIFDCPDQAGEAFREFIQQFYQQNALVRGQARIGDRLVDLENIQTPVLNIYARDDHLVPPDSSKALAGCISSEDYSELEFPGGHIGIYVSARAQSVLPKAIAEWLAERS